MLRSGALAALLLAGATAATAEDAVPRLTVAVQTSGTVNWEIQTILNHGLDRKNGFELAVMDVAGSPAGQVAFLGGEADVVVSDWIWVARQRAEGQDLAIIPYSKAVGGMMVPGDSPARTLADLKGEQIGIAGGPVDKSWIILRALAYEQGFDHRRRDDAGLRRAADRLQGGARRRGGGGGELLALHGQAGGGGHARPRHRRRGHARRWGSTPTCRCSATWCGARWCATTPSWSRASRRPRARPRSCWRPTTPSGSGCAR